MRSGFCDKDGKELWKTFGWRGKMGSHITDLTTSASGVWPFYSRLTKLLVYVGL